MTPEEMFDEAFDSAFKDRRNLISFLEGIDPAHVHWRPPDGEWSLHENLEHILLTDNYYARFIEKRLAEAAESGSWDTAPENPETMSREALRRREQGRVPAPDFLIPKGEGDFREMIAKLLPNREAVHQMMLPYRGTDMSRYTHAHFRYGDLNIYDRIVYSGTHDFLHQDQMTRVLQAPGYPGSG